MHQKKSALYLSREKIASGTVYRRYKYICVCAIKSWKILRTSDPRN